MRALDLDSKDDFKLLFKHRLRKLLLDANITTLNELCELSYDEIGEIKGVGWTSQVNIEAILHDNGLVLFGTPTDEMVNAALKVAKEENLINSDDDLIKSLQNYMIVQKMIRVALSLRE